MALLYAKSMIASFKNKTGREFFEWSQLLMNREFTNREEVKELLLKEGLPSQYLDFIFWTRHQHIKYTKVEVKEVKPKKTKKKPILTWEEELAMDKEICDKLGVSWSPITKGVPNKTKEIIFLKNTTRKK